MKNRILISICGFAAIACCEVRGELVSLDVHTREPFAGGMSFGEAGPYERISGIARYAIDPAHPRNRAVVDLDLAPRNAAGKVEFEADFFLLTPQDRAKANGAVLYDVNNRGGKLALRFFNQGGGGNSPSTSAHAGDGFLMRHGFTILWSGWLGELTPGDERLLLRAPTAQRDGKPLVGLVRYEMMTDKPVDVMPISRRDNHGSFPLTERGLREATLTWRMRAGDERVAVPREQWSLETTPIPSPDEGHVAGTLPQIRMKLAGGFRPGYLYELIAECEGSLVQGVCYPSVRDLISFLRYDSTDRNPLRTDDGKPAIRRAHGFGVSQSGRFLRNFLYLGFNADEANRIVFDGLIPHVAGGGLGAFNHRFGQPTKVSSQHIDTDYPSDHFPFAYGDDADPYTGAIDGLLRTTTADDPKLLPKVMHTQGSAEYWHRAGSLVHTDPAGKRDAEVPANVRIYTFGGTQHGPAAYPPSRGSGDNRLNPGDYGPFLRSLRLALDRWTRDGAEPPPSAYPKLADGTLVDFRQTSAGFPAVPGVRYPTVIYAPIRLDFGPDFAKLGYASVLPPKRLETYPALVPRVGADGNELGTLLPVEVAVPTATYTGWNLRRAESGAEGELESLMGSYLPFPKTKADRAASGDPRLSVAERYGTYAEYEKQYRAVCDDYVRRGYVLAEDVERLMKQAERAREMFAE